VQRANLFGDYRILRIHEVPAFARAHLMDSDADPSDR
jgi:hypothetical protein